MTVIPTPLPNPYNPLQPTETPAFFYGRQEVFAFFRQHLVGTAHDRALVLIGRRGLGKTSTLRQLPYQLEDTYRLCIVSLAAVDLNSEQALLAAMVDEIHLALERAEVSTYRLPDWPTAGEGEAPPDLRAWFKTEYLDVALAALRVRHLLLAFDDAHLLLDAIDRGTLPPDWMGYLADLLATYERLDLVLALDAAYEDRILSIELLNNPALHFRLAEIGRADAERLVREPVAGIYDYAEGVIEQILSMAGGHPFLLHSVCRLLFRRSEERNHSGPIVENDLLAIRDAALDQADEIFVPLWSAATHNERLTLTALVRMHALAPGEPVTFDAILGWLTGAGYAINKTQLAAALRSLDYQGLIHAEADTYTLPAQLIAAWVEANVSPPVVAERPSARRDTARLVQAVGLLAVILIVGGLGVAALSGVFRGDDDGATPGEPGAPTATLSLNLEATRQSEAATQTAQARPTSTLAPTTAPAIAASPTLTPTRRATATPVATDTPAATATARATATLTVAPTLTPTRRATATPTATASASATASRTPTASATATRTNTPAPSATPTPRPMRTPRPTRTPVRIRPTATPDVPPTNTPRPTPTPTLHPGG